MTAATGAHFGGNTARMAAKRLIHSAERSDESHER